jgi:mono/diheme cytochrome c family protein
MRTAIFALLTGIVVLLPAAEPALAQESLKADVEQFDRLVAPFFKANCIRCHGERKQEAKLSVAALGGDLLAGGAALESWQAIAERLKAGEMPPADEPQPAPELIKKVTDWIDAELVKAGKSGVRRAGSLRTGNHISHELLFNPKAVQALDAPPRIWRLSPQIYTEMVKGIDKNLKVAQPFAVPAGDGFKDLAGAFGIDESTSSQLIRNAEIIVESQLGLGKGKKAVKEFVPLLDESKPATRGQVEAALRKQFDTVLHRAPTSAELEKLVVLHGKNVKTGGAVEGTKITLMAPLLSPEVLFRLELGRGGQAGAERLFLSPREMAFAIAYALTDRAPDPALLKAADRGLLKTKEDVARETRRILDDARTEKPRILRFFHEYFGYREAVNVFKDKKDFGSHEPRTLVDDTDELIGFILQSDKDVFRELLTTNKTFVAYRNAAAMKAKRDAQQDMLKKSGKFGGNPVREIFRSYSLDDYPLKQPVELPAEQRAGILTQPSWLVAFSENKDNHAIRRGKWVRERLLGGVVPDLPISVDAQLPEDPHKTLRQRMTVTTAKYCWQCHQKMNPLGLTFENFDGFGRFRTTELGKPVDATGQVGGTGVKEIEGPVKDSIELIHRLAKSDHARQVFIRHAFRYWLGRDERLGDAESLRGIDKAYVESGGSMKALIVAILSSDAFLYRTVAATAKKK